MNPILMNIVVETCAFLELSGDDVLDPDVAIKQLEQIGAMLRALSRDDADRFVGYVAGLAAQAREDGDGERQLFLESLSEGLGLSD